jgi:hypothetical protein
VAAKGDDAAAMEANAERNGVCTDAARVETGSSASAEDTHNKEEWESDATGVWEQIAPRHYPTRRQESENANRVRAAASA